MFVGGLPKNIDPKELKTRFSKFGKISDVQIKNKTDATGKYFDDVLQSR